jgi:hypothetical protein
MPLLELELRPLGRPACSQSLYRLLCPGLHTFHLFVCSLFNEAEHTYGLSLAI